MRGVQTIIRKVHTVIKKPRSLFIRILYLLSPLFSDKRYLKLLFLMKMGYKLNLENPQTYNEKLQWLKLYYRDPSLSKLVDKYEVKECVKRIIGNKYVVQNYGVWNSFDEIDFDKLPSQFVLKTTHDQGGVVICQDKLSFDLKNARIKINKHLKKSVFYRYGEWPYKNVVPRIIAEEYLVDESKIELKDYKFFCFNGEPKVMFIATERQTGDVKFDFYDIDFNHLDVVQVHKQSGKVFEKPKCYDLMIDLAKKLSKGLPHVRIDFYNIDGEIFFGENTFFHHGGLEPFYPQKWDYIFGSWIDLNICKANNRNIASNI